LPKQITSISHAVVYLGFNTIKNLALIIAAVGMLPSKNAAGFDVDQYLMHSLSTATIAKNLAQRFADADPMDCFIAGLLHDFGKIVFAQYMPHEFKQALDTAKTTNSSLHQALRDIIGADHAMVGAMLVKSWNFAPSMITTIENQFNMPTAITTDMACVFTANQISKKLKLGCGGNPSVYELPLPVSQRMEGSLDDIIDSLGDLSQLLAEAEIFAKI
jgi:putative nucleotidyltransferase with HDIG domain